MRLVITMPVYEDWESAALLCEAINTELSVIDDVYATVLMIDDGSIRQIGPEFTEMDGSGLRGIWLLRLRRNLGHQRAIAVALAYIQQHVPCDAVIVMDADGEDRAADIPRLVEAFRAAALPVTIFAERGRRMDGLIFRTSYQIYRFFHFLVTGRRIRFGNFSLMPADHLASIVAFPELWNHYAAAVLKSRLPYSTIRADRGHRLRGESRMNFVSLVIHGLSALFASYEVVSTRLLVGTGLLSVLTLALLVLVAAIRIFTQLAIPGWATIIGGLLLLMALQFLSTALSIMFSVMMNRSSLGFLPLRDYSFFVRDCRQISA
jgi:polyisoprenyl-phosphate glycosyltransferase